MQTLSVKVARKILEADDIVSFELRPVDDVQLPPFSAGSHVDVQLRSGLVRQYSLCNHSDETHRYMIGVLRDPHSRGGSTAMHELQEGDVMQISQPRNHFPLVHARRSLLFAGGIGITPILCMAEVLAHDGKDFDMHYCTRSPAKTAFRDRINSARFGAHVHFHFDDGDAAQKLDLELALADPDPDTHLYVCGPSGFISYIANGARERGWRDEQIHFEYFTVAQPDPATARSFDVKIASTGRIIHVPEDTSVTMALSNGGIDIPVSCEQGICGTCLTRIIEGEPDHRDHFLTDAEKARNDQFTPCCSRAKGGILVLDL
jgi:vanillate monooxygenase ferredoxin subunit